MNVVVFEANVRKAHEACGNQGIVTIDALSKVFTTPAWAQLTDKDSNLCRVLYSYQLKNFTGIFSEDKGLTKE